MKSFFYLLIMTCLISCSEGLPEAKVLSNPPKTEKGTFDETVLVGSYKQSGAPTMFLWPIYKKDEVTGELIEMTFNEKVATRAKITALDEEVNYYSAEVAVLEGSLKAKYEEKNLMLEKEFTAKKCYSFCDPIEDFLCDPEDHTILEVDTWIVSEDPDIQKQVLSCASNQETRADIKNQWNNELKNSVIPLQKKAGAAALELLKTIGDRNYFTGLTKFHFEYSVYENVKRMNVTLKYGDIEFSSLLAGPTLISDIQLDGTNGFLSFRFPAIDLEDSNKVYGEFKVDIEFSPLGENLKLGGDIRLTYFDGRPERVGRFASGGRIIKK